MKSARLLAPVLAALFLQAQTTPLDILSEQTPKPDKIFTYGSDASQYAELRVPPGAGPFPVAIVIHGGCWRATISGFPPEATSLDLVRPLAAALTNAGYATWNVEFRRIGNGGGWPATFDDINTATGSLRALAPIYHLDLKRVIAIGHSSGGHLAEWLASEPKARKSDIRAKEPLPIEGVVDLDGPPSLINPPGDVESVCGDAVAELLGGTIDRYPDRYRDASALVPMGVPEELFTTGGFGRAWADLSIDFAARAKKAGDRVTVHTEDAADHFDIINPQSKFWPAVLRAVDAVSVTK